MRPLGADNELAEAGEAERVIGGPVSTQYLSLSLSGPIVSGIYYDVFGISNTGSALSFIDGSYQRAAVYGFAAGASGEFFLDIAQQPTAILTVLYASGDADASSFLEGNSAGPATAFIPVSAGTLGSIANPRLTNITGGRLDLSVKPLGSAGNTFGDNFTVTASATTLFRPTLGPVSLGGVTDDSDAYYLGTEANLGLNARITSDFGLTLGGGFFFPNANAFDESTTRYNANLSLAFSL
jgi:hypothetical protein